MNSQIPFSKIHGAGNDFILIDNRPGYFNGGEHSLFRRLCQRPTGIGADGLLLLTYQDPGSVELAYFNADGRPASMCGNGARCAIFFMNQLNPALKAFTLSIAGKRYRGEMTGTHTARILWNFIPQVSQMNEFPLPASDDFQKMFFVNTGVPHLVITMSSPLENLDVSHWGSFFRHHRFFQPEGTNVDFIRIEGDRIHIRTFERGVEGETLACGTGILAAACVAREQALLLFPAEIVARGGRLTADLTPDGQWWLEGPVQPVYTGFFNPEDFTIG